MSEFPWLAREQCKHEIAADTCVLCNPPKAEAATYAIKPARYITARFPARFDSECADCMGDMIEGDPICRTSDAEYICEECSGQLSDLRWGS